MNFNIGSTKSRSAGFFEVLDKHAPTDKLDNNDPHKARAAELSGDDEDTEEKIRDFLKRKGLSSADVDRALEIAMRSPGEPAQDRIVNYLSGKERPPPAMDERTAADFFARFPDAARIAIGFGNAPNDARLAFDERSRRAPAPSESQLQDFFRMFPGAEHIGT